MTSRSTREFGTPERRTLSPSEKKAREAERAEKLATTRRSAFDVADEQAAESRGAYKPESIRKSSNKSPDNRGGMLGKAKRNIRGRQRRLRDAEKKAN